MLFASVMSDLLLWMLVGGYTTNAALNRMFGEDYAKQMGDCLRVWWRERRTEAINNEEP